MRHMLTVVAVALVALAACAPPPPPMDVVATAYCLQGTTKSGMETEVGMIAADPAVLPLGSVVEIEGLEQPLNGTYTVADTGGAIKGQRIDIFMEDCGDARQFGRQDAQLRLIESAAEQEDSES